MKPAVRKYMAELIDYREEQSGYTMFNQRGFLGQRELMSGRLADCMRRRYGVGSRPLRRAWKHL